MILIDMIRRKLLRANQLTSPAVEVDRAARLLSLYFPEQTCNLISTRLKPE